MTCVSNEFGSTFTRANDPLCQRPVFRLTSFVKRDGPSNIDVLVVDRAGNPLSNIVVAFYWPDAPESSRPDEWYPKKVTGTTGLDGKVGFAIGGGSYIMCCGCGGPHAVWVSQLAPDQTPLLSDLADHLGMLAGTNHRHLDLIFQRVDPPPALPPDNGSHCPM